MKEKILALLEQKKYPEIAALVKDMNPADAAVLLEGEDAGQALAELLIRRRVL